MGWKGARNGLGESLHVARDGGEQDLFKDWHFINQQQFEKTCFCVQHVPGFVLHSGIL